MTVHKMIRYAVIGMGRFPIDMLRYDGVYPMREQDSNTLEDWRRMNVRTVVVEGRSCTIARWGSFGWSISPIVE